MCVRNLTFGPIFSSKTTKYRRISSVPLLHIGVPPVMVTGAPLVFFWASLYNGNHSLRQEKISCPVNLRGVGNDFSITFLCFQDTTPTFCKRGGSFCIPADMKRHGEEGRPSTTAERKIELGLAVCRAVFPQPLQRTDSVAFRN